MPEDILQTLDSLTGGTTAPTSAPAPAPAPSQDILSQVDALQPPTEPKQDLLTTLDTLAPVPAKQSQPIRPGNIDLEHRPIVHNPDGTISTLRTMGITVDGKYVNIPTISPDGKHWTPEEAIQHYKDTGQQLGVYATQAEADAAAQRLHEEQAKRYEPRGRNYKDAFPEQAKPTSQIDQFRQRYGEPAGGYPAVNEFMNAAARGTAGLTESGATLLSAFGETLGAHEFALDAKDYAAGVHKYAQSTFPSQAPRTVEELIANGDAGDYVNFAANALGEQVPVVASIFAGGGAGVGAGRLANQLLAGRLITPAQANALALRFAVTGGAAGSGLVDLGINTAETLSEQQDANKPTDLTTALTAGSVKTALDVLPVAGFARKLGIGADVAEGLLGKIAKQIDDLGVVKTGFLGGVTEMTTEGLQEIVDIAARKYIDENYDVLSPEAISRVTNAAATGLLVGGVFGAGAGSMARERSTRPDGLPLDSETSPPLEEAAKEIGKFGPRVSGVQPEPGSMMADIVAEAKAENAAKVPPAPDPSIRQTKKQAKQFLREEVQKSLKLDDFSWNEKWLENLWQVAEKNSHITHMQEHLHAIEDLYSTQKHWISRAVGRTKEWNNLGKEQSKKLTEFMLDLTEGKYLQQATTKTGKPKIRKGLPVLAENRPPTEHEVHALRQKHGLSDEAFTLYGKIREDFNAVIDQLETLEKATVEKQLAHDPVLMHDAQANIENAYTLFRSGVPYFPMARFGDYRVVVRDKNGQKVDVRAVTSAARQKAMARRLAREFPADHTITMDKYSTEEDNVFRGLPPSMLEQLETKLNLNDKQKGQLKDAIIEASPAKSFRKNMQQRQRIPGFSRDGIKSYADYFQRVAGFLARLEHGRRIEDAIEAMDAEIAEMSKLAPNLPLNKRRDISTFMKHERNYLFNPTSELNLLKSLAFHFYLTTAPDSMFMNLTQVGMVTWPYLSAQFGDVASTKQLGSAYKDIRRLYEKGDMSHIPEDEVMAVREGVASGKLEENQGADLAAEAEGDNLARMVPGNDAKKLLKNISHYSSYGFQATEKLNRRVSYRAAYRLARDNPNAKRVKELVASNPREFTRLKADGFTASQAAGVMFAKETVRHTQFEYSRAFRPRFMQGKKGAIFTFFNYTQNMLWAMRYSPGGRRTALMLMLLAGASGLPGADDVKAVAKLASRAFGKDFDADRWVRETMAELGAGDYADLFLHGLGRDVFGFDLSQRFGMGRLVPGLAEVNALTDGRDPAAAIGKVALGVGGAPASALLSPAQALLSNSTDTWMRVEKGMPRSWGNVSKAVRRAYRGFESTPSGEVLQTYDLTNPRDLADLVGTALGFNPTPLSQRWDRKIQEDEAVRFWQGRRTILLEQLWRAKMVVKDREAAADVVKAVKRFNKGVPFPSLAISGKEMLESMRSRELERQKKQLGVGGARRYVPLRRSIQQLHPEDAIDIQDVK